MGFFSSFYCNVPDADTAQARVEAGAAYLERKVGPEWERLIDVEILDVASPLRCVLAQLGHHGHLLLQSPGKDAACGFSCGVLPDVMSVLCVRTPSMVRAYERLNEAWRTYIRQRQHDKTKLMVERQSVNKTRIEDSSIHRVTDGASATVGTSA